MEARHLNHIYVLVFLMLIYAFSGAGYYNDSAYTAYLESGITGPIGNYKEPFEFIGTVVSVLCVTIAALNFKILSDRRFLIIVPLHVWLILSSLWTPTILQSVMSSIKIAVYLITLIVCSDRLSERNLKWGFVAATFTIIAISLYLCLSDVQFRVSIGADGWRGLFPHKNTFAVFCFFSTTVLYSFRFTNKLFLYAMSLTLLFCIIMSQSKTAMGMTVAFFIMRAAYKLILLIKPDPYLARRALNFTLMIILTFVALTFYYLVSEQEVNFSGRTYIWRWYLQDLGGDALWGMGGSTAPSDPAFVERAQASGILLSSDNSYVMILYNLGIIGLLLYAYAVVRMITMAVSYEGQNDATALSMIYCYIIYATMESGNKLMFSFSTMAILLVICRLKRPNSDLINLQLKRARESFEFKRTSLDAFR